MGAIAIVKGDINDSNEIKDNLNSYNSQIQFTMEEEKNNEITFSDILIKRTEEGTTETKVYRKNHKKFQLSIRWYLH